MTARPNHAERLKRIAEAAPLVTDLARAISLSARAEPELVRKLRLMLIPNSGAWLEADLYFSALIGQRTPDWLVLAPDFAAELREDLSRRMRTGADDRRRIEAIRRVIGQAHVACPFELRLEEDVVWLAVERRGGARQAQLAINQRLREIFAYFLQSPEQSIPVARWFSAAAHRLPRLARNTEAFTLLAFASSVALGGRVVEGSVKATRDAFDELSRYLPDTVQRRPLWAALTTRGVHFSFAPIAGYKEIEAPRTDPVLFDIRVNNGVPRLAHLASGQSGFVELEPGEIQIRTLSRDAFRLRAVEERQARSENATFADVSRIPIKFDVYVSYAHTDSEWIRFFTRRLEQEVWQLLGREVRFYREEMLKRSASFEKQMEDAIQNSALLLAILTPSYLNSKFCGRELLTFEAADREQTGGILVESRSRILVVSPIPVEREDIPAALQQLLTYQFFSGGPPGEYFRTFDPKEPDYFKLLNRLAQDIAAMLRAIQARREKVYLDATSDLAAYRERLERELEERGYAVVSQIRDLATARLAVLLIGREAESTLERFLKVIYQRAGHPALAWIPPGEEEAAPASRFVAELGNYAGLELLLHQRFEQFIHAVTDALRPQEERPEAPVRVSSIFLWCDPRDAVAASPLREHLIKNEFQVYSPLEIRDRQTRNTMLEQADAVLIYWGQAAELQVKSFVSEARRRLKQVTLYSAPPDTPEKRLFSMPQVSAIHSENSVEEGLGEASRMFRGDHLPNARA